MDHEHPDRQMDRQANIQAQSDNPMLVDSMVALSRYNNRIK